MFVEIDGPACPRCGCRDTELVGRGTRWGKPIQQRRCRHCRREWTVRPENGDRESAQYVPVLYSLEIRCPSCDSTNTVVTSTRRPIRHHKCRDCGICFKSYDNRV